MELPFAVDASTMMPKPDGSSSTASSLVTSSSQGSLIPAEHPEHLQQQQQQQPQQHHHPHHDGTEHPQHYRGHNNNHHHHHHHQQHPHPPPPANVAYRTQQSAAPIHQQQLQHHQHHHPQSTPDAAAAPLSSLAHTGGALKAAGSKVSSVLMNFGFHRNSSNTNQRSGEQQIPLDSSPAGTHHQQQQHAVNHHHPQQRQQQQLQQEPQHDNEETTIDFAYINVTDEDEVDIWLDDSSRNNHNHNAAQSSSASALDDHEDGGDDEKCARTADVLAVLLQSQRQQQQSPHQGRLSLVECTERANAAAVQAHDAKQDGRLQEALDRHTEAAQLFHEAAVRVKECDASMANSLLLLSQTQAKSALALKRIVKLRPNALATLRSHRLRATVRGALDSNTEADISDSQFLGRATTTNQPQQQPQQQESQPESLKENNAGHSPSMDDDSQQKQNPVDEMMELERELRDMDMALELGNSIASLDARTQNRMKSSVSSESFMVVPGAGSYMSSSSIILGPVAAGRGPVSSGGTAGARARANRVQSVGRSAHHAAPAPVPASVPASYQKAVPQQHPPQPHSLESSWWGNSSSTASQVLSSSVIAAAGHGQQQQQQQQPANTKQLMRLMDSLRTLGDENAALLREVEDAEAARVEAKAARQQMKRFKEEYGKRFSALKEALEKFRKGYPGDTSINGEQNPVTSSEFARSASAADQLRRQEQLIRKLTADLKKEKEESKKKDGALRKYENFYREVKARSAQKAAQRQHKAKAQPLPLPPAKHPAKPSR